MPLAKHPCANHDDTPRCTREVGYLPLPAPLKVLHADVSLEQLVPGTVDDRISPDMPG